jgi:hypothetical protein
MGYQASHGRNPLPERSLLFKLIGYTLIALIVPAPIALAFFLGQPGALILMVISPMVGSLLYITMWFE